MRRFIRWDWFSVFLSYFKWYRKLHGGHWEYWIIDFPVCSEVWLYCPPEAPRWFGRPDPLCRSNVLSIEDWQ